MSNGEIKLKEGQMSSEMAKTLIKQKAFEAVKQFTDRMITEKVKTDEFRIHNLNDDGGSLLIGEIVDQLKSRGCTIDAIYGYPLAPAPDGRHLIREICIVCTNAEERRIIL